jgi:hypothetical protein
MLTVANPTAITRSGPRIRLRRGRARVVRSHPPRASHRSHSSLVEIYPMGCKPLIIFLSKPSGCNWLPVSLRTALAQSTVDRRTVGASAPLKAVVRRSHWNDGFVLGPVMSRRSASERN